MRPLRALLLGGLAGAVIAYVTAATIGLGLAAARLEVTIAAGPVVFLALDRSAEGSEATLGPGLLLVPLLFGVANAVAAAVLGARTRVDPMA